MSRRGVVAGTTASVIVAVAAVISPPSAVPQESEQSSAPAAVESTIAEEAAQLLAEVDLGNGRTVAGVEMPHLRTANARVYTTEVAGVWRTELTQEPVHYFDGVDRWRVIDSTLTADSTGGYRNGANSFDLTVGADPSTALTTVALGSVRSSV